LVFYALTLVPFSRQTLFPKYLLLNAQVSGALLNGVGEDIKVIGNSLISKKFSLTIERGCDAVEPAALFCAAVIASPVAWSARLLAVVVGSIFLMTLNLLRILSLYYTGAYFRKAFDIMHLDVWQALFILLALVLWALWASWATQRKKRRLESNAAA
jgi:exosortase/archaeosortase family protein